VPLHFIQYFQEINQFFIKGLGDISQFRMPHQYTVSTSAAVRLGRRHAERESLLELRRVVPRVVRTVASLLVAGGATTPQRIAAKLQIAEWQVRWAMAKIMQRPHLHRTGLGGYLCAHPRHADFWHIEYDRPSLLPFKCTLPVPAEVRRQQQQRLSSPRVRTDPLS
jgi:hypothetical protein